MILLDSAALLAFLVDEPAAPEVAQLLRSGTAGIVSINLAEVMDIAVRRMGRSQDAVDMGIGPLLSSVLAVVTLDLTAALLGAQVRIRRYDAHTPLSLADCMLLGVAIHRSAAVATSDRLLATAADAENLKVTRLENSKGQRP